ncbi:hypothetical protein G6M50_06125 [Agrobacterium rhizogenes]|nr:hypothetical protein [Rhizobium rhizogenes]NTJ77379.1 hypothetical protein [Rhizobium rhizogenes]
MTLPPIADIDLPFDDDEANQRWLQEKIEQSILDLLSKKPKKPIDPTAPFPHWFKRAIQKEWIKAERERRSKKDAQ